MDTLLLETEPSTWTSELSRIADGLRSAQPSEALDDLLHHLRALKQRCDSSSWQVAVGALRAHPLHQALLGSPLTGRAFRKPRGYAGDAVLLDVIYGTGDTAPDVTRVGQTVYDWEFESHASRSTRARKARLAREFDSAALQHGSASVLSLACGHLREAGLSEAARNNRLRITAVDQDAESVARVRHDYSALGVSARQGSVVDALKGRFTPQGFHLVYAAGLYDYLERKLATALTASLFRYVAPGGSVLVANFTPDFLDIAYLEACQDWHLLYRDEAQMRELLAGVPEEDIAGVEQFREHEGAITYLRITRR